MERHQDAVQVVDGFPGCVDVAPSLPLLGSIDASWGSIVHLAVQVQGTSAVIICKYITCAIWDPSFESYKVMNETMHIEHSNSQLISMDKQTVFVAGGRETGISAGTEVVESLNLKTMTWNRLAVIKNSTLIL